MIHLQHCIWTSTHGHIQGLLPHFSLHITTFSVLSRDQLHPFVDPAEHLLHLHACSFQNETDKLEQRFTVIPVSAANLLLQPLPKFADAPLGIDRALRGIATTSQRA